jgi:N-acetylglucosamine kinase-like BadF-type ATPase
LRQVLAVDGGQSAIRVCLSSAGEPVEVEGVSRLEGDTISSVAEAVASGWRKVGAPTIERVVLGLTTAPTDDPSRQRLCSTVAARVDAPEVWLADDAVSGHAGALSLGWGCSVIIGTGVASLTMPREGDARIIGGHGYLLGDEGGAFWIGGAGIRAVLRATDGRGASTALVAPAERHFGGLEDLGDRLHSSDRPVDAIARFAPAVLEVAASGDAVASAIVVSAVIELLALVRTAVLGVAAEDDPVPLALGGRLVEQGILRDRLEEAILRELPNVMTRSADSSPLDGALLLGREADPGPYRDLVYVWGTAA